MAIVVDMRNAKKHTWDGRVISTTADDRFSPSRDSLDSGFDSSFPASPDSQAALVPVELPLDAPPQLDKCPSLLPSVIEDVEEDDEPVCKMPRLLPMGEEPASSSSEGIEHSTPRSVPEADEEPQPETAAVSSAIVEDDVFAKPTKRVRVITPTDSTDLQNPYSTAFKPRHCCHWADCDEQFFDINELFDHAMSAHLDELRPSSSGCMKSASNTVQRKMRPARDEQKENDNAFQCLWVDCEMSLKRGTAEKKYEWLRSHFRARHASKAQPFRCLMAGCPIRFSTEKALHAHLLSSHDDRRTTRKAQPTVVKSISCINYTLPVRSESYGVYDFMDKRTFNMIGQKVEAFYAEENSKAEAISYEESIDSVKLIPRMKQTETIRCLRELFPKRIENIKRSGR
ncbi:C2H2-type domain-containing protein [Aphelenchoides besseyi]|nr:C2H2-type domain-containing protein [Aphelenchoides besseyi]KAI6228259.1 C2H2-type domain-containing protein [Aphelenchoides besseyi]